MVRKIRVEDLLIINLVAARKGFKLVDVRNRQDYLKEHIKGALSLPVEEIGIAADKVLDKEDLVVVYCASLACQASTQAAERLVSMGYKHVLDYKGGLLDYKESGLPLEQALQAP